MGKGVHSAKNTQVSRNWNKLEMGKTAGPISFSAGVRVTSGRVAFKAFISPFTNTFKFPFSALHSVSNLITTSPNSAYKNTY